MAGRLVVSQASFAIFPRQMTSVVKALTPRLTPHLRTWVPSKVAEEWRSLRFSILLASVTKDLRCIPSGFNVNQSSL